MTGSSEPARGYFGALYEGDVEGALGYLADDVEFRSPVGTMAGRAEVGPFLEAFAEGFPDARFDVSGVVTDGSTVAIEGTYSGTHSGTLRSPAGEIPATGKAVAIPYVTVFDVEGDLITSHRAYWDQVALMSQLGLMPPPG